MRLPRKSLRPALSTLVSAALCLPLPLAAAPPAHKDTVWNYDGGVYFVTDGAIPGGSCFRLSGRVTAPGFFDDLKRIDHVNANAEFRRGKKVITEFPDQLRLQFVIFDFPCSLSDGPSPARTLLTREQVASLHLNLFWKRGVELRPVERVNVQHFSVDPLVPLQLAAERALQERFEWSYAFLVPSTGVPLTDSLVLIVRSREGRIAARVAARL